MTIEELKKLKLAMDAKKCEGMEFNKIQKLLKYPLMLSNSN
jgi:hypothetical protein